MKLTRYIRSQNIIAYILSMDLKKVISERGWTLEKLAAEMVNTRKDGKPKGVSQATVSQIINGNPTVDKLQEISNIMGISLSELLREDEPVTTIQCPHCGKSITLKAE